MKYDEAHKNNASWRQNKNTTITVTYWPHANTHILRAKYLRTPSSRASETHEEQQKESVGAPCKTKATRYSPYAHRETTPNKGNSVKSLGTHPHLGAFGERGWGSSWPSLAPALVSCFALLVLDTIFLVSLRAKATSRTPSTSATELGLIVSRTALANLQDFDVRSRQSE